MSGEILYSLPSIGDYINTPRFLRVRIDAVFAIKGDAKDCGYTETTHFWDKPFEVWGKHIGPNRMRFAAICKDYKD